VLKRSNRIHGRATVSNIVKNGESNKTRFFSYRRLPNEFGHNRYAIVISKKVEKSAVKRNLKRRQIYKSIQDLEKEGNVPSGASSDIVFLVRMATMQLSYKEVKEAIHTLLKKYL